MIHPRAGIYDNLYPNAERFFSFWHLPGEQTRSATGESAPDNSYRWERGDPELPDAASRVITHPYITALSSL